MPRTRRVPEAIIDLAIQDLQNGVYPSVRAAARAHGLTHSTLLRRLQGGVSQREAHEQQHILTPQ